MSAICFKKLLERGINASLDCEPNSDRRENLGTRFCAPYGKDIGCVTCECCKSDWFVYTWRPEIWHPRQPWTNEKTPQCMMSVWPTWDVIRDVTLKRKGYWSDIDYKFISRGAGVLPYINHVVCSAPLGRVFTPFWSRIGYGFRGN